MSERFHAAVAGTSHPLAHGPFADAERFGNLTLGPPLLFEPPGM
jgi:hypothetical protein